MTNFSVIIPCFNCTETLSQTLDSCINQTVKCYEIILIDDCSTDNIFSIIEVYKKEANFHGITFKYRRLSDNSGPSNARNTGWDLATGDYVCFLDSDDVWHHDKIKILSQTIQKDQNQFICHNHAELHEFGDTSSNHLLRKVSSFEALLSNPAQPSCVTISKKIKERFDTGMIYCEDYELCIRLLKKYPLYKIEGEPLTLRPPRPAGKRLSGRRYKMRFGEIMAYYHFSKGIMFPLFPILLIYSIIKHIRSEIRYVNEKYSIM